MVVNCLPSRSSALQNEAGLIVSSFLLALLNLDDGGFPVSSYGICYNPLTPARKIMSPEGKPSRSARKKIRELKRESRDQDPAQWENMEQILKMRLGGREISSQGYSIIKDWFETRLEIRHKNSHVQDEARKTFTERFRREDIMAVKDALAIITQTIR